MARPPAEFEDDGVIRFLSADEAAERRSQYLEKVLAPRVRGHFEKHEEVNSAIFSVCQYFNDEAADEVHPAWEFRKGRASEPLHSDSLGMAPRSWPEHSLRAGSLWSGQVWGIPLFAAYAHEAFDYGRYPEDYGVVAWFERVDNDVVVHETERPPRPWLIGVVPDYRHGRNHADLRLELDIWLQWLTEPVEWIPELIALRDEVLECFDEFHNVVRRIGKSTNKGLARQLMIDRDTFAEWGPQPFPKFTNGILGRYVRDSDVNSELQPQFNDRLEALRNAYGELAKYLPVPGAAYNS